MNSRATVGSAEWWLPRAVPIALAAMLLPWGIALIVRYLPLAGLYRAAIATAFGGLYAFLATPMLRWLGGEARTWQPVDLGVWRGNAIAGNVLLLILLAALLVAVVLAVAAALRRR